MTGNINEIKHNEVSAVSNAIAVSTVGMHTGINRQYKDRLFKFLFGNPEHRDWTLSLYNAVNGTAYENPDDITFTTIENAVYMGMRNDVSLLLADTMDFYEQQSTYNPNMPMRFLVYALDSMPDDSLIKPLIIANRAEVKRMFITEYDEAATMEKFKKEYFAQGLSQGISQGIIQGKREQVEKDARVMFQKGLTFDAIAEILDTSVEDIENILAFNKT